MSANGTIWAGSLDAGLYRFDGTRFHAIQQREGLSAEDIASLHADREGNLWVGTRGGGINRLRPRVMELVGADAGLPVESLRSICRDTSGAIWAAYYCVHENGLLA